MARPKHSLQINLIDKFAKEFIENKGYECLIEEHPNKTITEKHITIFKDKVKGKLVLYISGGQVSYQVQTGNQDIRVIGEKCWEYILEHTKLPEVSAKSFSAKNIDADLFDCFIDDLGNDHQIEEIDNSDTSIRNRYLIHGEYGASLSTIFYNNGTLYIQGRITPLFVEIVSKAIEDLVPAPQQVKEVFLSIEPEKGQIIDPEVNKHIGKMEHISGSKIEKMIRTSIQLVNYAWPLDDYCCYTHSILRALEGLIRVRLMEDEPDDFEFIGEFFHEENSKFVFNADITRYDEIPALKDSLEEAYDFYNKNRHSISHVDKANIETSRMMDYDEAVDVIQECLKRINKLCNNWN